MEIPDEVEVMKGSLPRRVYKRFLFWKKVIDSPFIPKEVSEFFKDFNKEKFLYKNLAYKLVDVVPREAVPSGFYKIFDVVPNEARKLAQCPGILSTMDRLESLVGRELKTEYIFSLLGFKSLEYNDKKDFCLSFGDEEIEGKTRKIKLSLIADIGDYDCHIGGKPIGIFQDLAELTYEGRINS